jgi:hypothetical protein
MYSPANISFACQGLNETHPSVAEIDEKNALALAIVPIDDVPRAAPSFENGVTGWELALVTAPSSNETAVASGKKLVLYIFPFPIYMQQHSVLLMD